MTYHHVSIKLSERNVHPFCFVAQKHLKIRRYFFQFAVTKDHRTALAINKPMSIEKDLVLPQGMNVSSEPCCPCLMQLVVFEVSLWRRDES